MGVLICHGLMHPFFFLFFPLFPVSPACVCGLGHCALACHVLFWSKNRNDVISDVASFFTFSCVSVLVQAGDDPAQLQRDGGHAEEGAPGQNQRGCRSSAGLACVVCI